MIYHVHVKGKKGYTKLFSVEADQYVDYGAQVTFFRDEKKFFGAPRRVQVATLQDKELLPMLILPYELETPCQSRPTEQ